MVDNISIVCFSWSYYLHIHISHSFWGIFQQLVEQKMLIPFCPILKTAQSQLHSQSRPLQIIKWTSPQDWLTEIPLLLLTLQNFSITVETLKGKSVRVLHVLSFLITCIWTPSSFSHGYSLTRGQWAFWRNSSICLCEDRTVTTKKINRFWFQLCCCIEDCCEALHNSADLSRSHENQLWRLMYVWQSGWTNKYPEI